MTSISQRALSAFVVVLALMAMPTSAQQDVSSSDVQRLQDLVNDAGTEIAAFRRQDPTAARKLQSELDGLQDDVIYMRVSVRKQQPVPRAEYTEIRDRLESLRSRARGEDTANTAAETQTPAPAPSADAPAPASRSKTAGKGVVPVGAELDVRLQSALNSGTAQVEDRFEATTVLDLEQDGGVLIPAGSTVRGVITDVKSAGRVERTGSLSLSFDQVTIGGRSYPIRGTVTETVASGGYRQDAGKIGTGAIVGGIIGGILGGGQGALAGVLIGGGGVVAATEGQDVDLKPGTVLRMRFDSELTLR